MRYVLGRECIHEDHKGEKCTSISYLHTDDGKVGNRTVKVFESKGEALSFMKEYRYSPKVILVMPYEEGIYE